jgi:hypothetical protein
MKRLHAIILVVAASFALSTAACRDSPPAAPKTQRASQQQAQPTSTAAAGLPDWVPIYPGAKVSGAETRNTGVETYTTFQLDSPADCQKIFAWYDERLKVAGFNVVGTTNRLDACDGIMRAEGPGHTRAMNLNGGGATGGPSRLGVQAVVRQQPGDVTAGGEASVPAWIPQYPGSKAANVVTKQEGPERSTDFSFTTADDAKAVIDWYERRLKDAKFTIVSSTVFDASTAKLTAQDATGRSMMNIRMEPAGGRKVVAIEAREGMR